MPPYALDPANVLQCLFGGVVPPPWPRTPGRSSQIGLNPSARLRSTLLHGNSLAHHLLSRAPVVCLEYPIGYAPTGPSSILKRLRFVSVLLRTCPVVQQHQRQATHAREAGRANAHGGALTADSSEGEPRHTCRARAKSIRSSFAPVRNLFTMAMVGASPRCWQPLVYVDSAMRGSSTWRRGKEQRRPNGSSRARACVTLAGKPGMKRGENKILVIIGGEESGEGQG